MSSKRRKVDTNPDSRNEYTELMDEKDEVYNFDNLPDAESFFNDFIKLRKPCKFNTSILTQEELAKFNLDQIKETLNCDDYNLQVERKINGGFGNGGSNSRIKMKLTDLINSFKNGDCDYYLTTQYDFDDPGREEIENKEGEDEDEEEEDDEEQESFNLNDNFSDTSSIDMNNLHDDFIDEEEETNSQNEPEDGLNDISPIIELYQPPLTNLIKQPQLLPTNPPFITLIPQQINLWMGSHNHKESKSIVIDEKLPNMGLGKQIPNNGVSSGLHHDHADNLYILISGRKRFTIYSPKDALKLYTVGEIYKIYSSGIIDYQNDANWKHVRDDGAIIEDIIQWKLDNEDNDNERQKILKQLQVEINRNDQNKQHFNDPCSFSKIPPCLLHLDEVNDLETKRTLHSFIKTHFPQLENLTKWEIYLNPGEMLYLPCGWFHEVSSFNDEDSNCHIALNYWFIPPNNASFEQPYKDDYWTKDWEKTKLIIDRVRNGEIELNL